MTLFTPAELRRNTDLRAALKHDYPFQPSDPQLQWDEPDPDVEDIELATAHFAENVDKVFDAINGDEFVAEMALNLYHQSAYLREQFRRMWDAEIMELATAIKICRARRQSEDAQYD